MTSITVEQVRATDSLYTLNMYYGDVYIGEYERSKHQNIERKKKKWMPQQIGYSAYSASTVRCR